MAKNREVSILLKAKDEASKAIDNIAKSSLPGLVKSIGATVAAYASFQTAANFIRESIKAAAEADRVMAQLEQALRSSGQEVERNARTLDRQADALAQVSKATDEQIKEAQTLLLTMGGLSADGLGRATKASLDLAAVLKTDLRSATLLVAKAAQGQTETLSRYGIVLKDGIAESEKFEAVLSAIATKAAGQARAEVENLEGAVIQLSKAWGDLQEEVASGGIGSVVSEALKAARIQVRGLTEDLKEGGLLGVLMDLDTVARAGAFSPLLGGLAAVKQRNIGIESLASATAEANLVASQGEAVWQGFAREGLAIANAQMDDLEKRTKKADKALGDMLAKLQRSQIDMIRGPREFPGILPDATRAEVDEALNSFTVSPDAINGWDNLRTNILAASVAIEASVSATKELNDAWGAVEESSSFMKLFGEQVEADIRDVAVGAVYSLSEAIADAAFTGNRSFKEMFQSILRGFARAIVQAIVLRAIMSSIGGFFGFSGGGVVGAGSGTVMMARGGLVPRLHAAAGMITPGAGYTDTVPAMLTPGEIVVPKRESQKILGGRAALVPAGADNGGVTVHFSPRIYALDGPSVKRVLLGSAREVAESLQTIRSRGYGG